MSHQRLIAFQQYFSHEASIMTSKNQDSWQLSLLDSASDSYRVAQLHDYANLPRSAFHWKPPVTFRLDARVSHEDLPGTWGFGFWNDPFSIDMGFRGSSRKTPVLPNAIWFFFASHHNYLTLYDNLPAFGNLAASIRSTTIPTPLLIAGTPLLIFLKIPSISRLLRKIIKRFVNQDAFQISIDPILWHNYAISWRSTHVDFIIDHSLIYSTRVVPKPPLGLIIWIDNQFASFLPSGKFRWGTLFSSFHSWLEVEAIEMI